jgi:hypothetical protein
MRRREFIAAIGGLLAWPVDMHGEDRERVRRIGILNTLSLPLIKSGYIDDAIHRE